MNFREAEWSYRGKRALFYDDVYLIGVDEELMFLDELALPVKDVEVILMLSRHSSVAGLPCLTAHVSGNLTDEARYGGRPRELAISHPYYMSKILRELSKLNDESKLGFLVSLEATHHGPSELRYPLVFVEIGSRPEDWGNKLAAKAVAQAIANALRGGGCEVSSSIGFGGGHYPPKLSRYVLNGGYIGHVFPKYVLSKETSFEMISKAVKRTHGVCDSLAVDWKGAPSQAREALKKFASAHDLRLIKL